MENRDMSESMDRKQTAVKENINRPLFSIIVVALNPGKKLMDTFVSIRKQTFGDYQVVVKDGGSTDGTVDRVLDMKRQWREGDEKVTLLSCADNGIYDGMNQAVSYAKGQYLYFLNCGDLFADENVLKRLAVAILKDRKKGREADLYYGNVLDAMRGQVVSSNPRIDAFTCYRHVPCHQACVYSAKLFAERGYDVKYRVRADYEHFLWCFFTKGVRPRYVALTLASYEGGGYSETKENLRRSDIEHREITARYMTVGQRFCYRFLLVITLAPLRRRMAESERYAGFYQKMKSLLYGRRS